MTMVEKMAKAIYERRNGYGCKAWSHQPASHREPYLADARSAMQAQSTPTDAMIVDGLIALVKRIDEMQGPTLQVKDGQLLSDEEAARRYMNLGARIRSGSEVEACWRAMITKALSEAETP